MPRLKGWIDRARKVAKERLPTEVVDAGKKLRDRVVERAPSPIADAIARVLPADEVAGQPSDESRAATSDRDDASAKAETATDAPPREDTVGRENPHAVLERVRAKADKGLKPEDRLVVIYATADESDAVAEIRENLEGVETEIRDFDLAKDPQTAKQLAKLSGVMVPPYVFINGRYWGAQYEIATLAANGDLENVVANRLDEISAEARRIGDVHESFSDEISVDNILERWKLGHILCVDDLDAWYEVDRDGTERFYYQGGPRPVEDMPSVAREIVDGVEREDFEVAWLLDPAVQIH